MERTFGIDELLSDAGWLRQLAASLVGPGQADDLVQDAWLTALRRPPRADREPRPWLTRVVQNLARNQHRGRARREAREAVARTERADRGPEELVQAAEAQRLLAESVTRLPEPLRVVIVLRYFQGLDSNAAAARLGLSASAVRTRLQSALAELRADLDRRTHGGRDAWALLLAPLARSESAAGTAATPLAAAGAWTSVLVACVVTGGLVTLAALSWNARRGGAPDAGFTPEPFLAGAVPAGPAPASRSPGAGREASAPAPDAAAPAVALIPGEPDELLRVSGRVLVDGRPPEWPIELTLHPTLPRDPPRPDERRPRQARPVLTLAPEQRGEFRFPPLPAAWRGSLLVADFELAGGGSSIPVQGPLPDLVIELRSAPEIVGRILSPDGQPVPGLQGTGELAFGAHDEPASVIDSFRLKCRDDGRFRIPSRRQDGWGSFAFVFESEAGYLRHRTPQFAASSGLDLGELVLGRTHALEFTVRDSHGTPLAGAVARVEGVFASASAATDADGRGVLAWCPEQATSVRFSALAHADRVLSIEPGGPCEVTLEPLAVLELTLGNSMAQAKRVTLSAEGAAFVWDPDGWDGEATFQSEGGAARPSVRRRPVAPAQRFEYEFAAAGELRLVGLTPRLALTFEVQDSDGRTLATDTLALEPGARGTLVLGEGDPLGNGRKSERRERTMRQEPK